MADLDDEKAGPQIVPDRLDDDAEPRDDSGDKGKAPSAPVGPANDDGPTD